MEIIEQIGSYAGLAAVLGLAVLSALYFSQARDVRRLREWAGRAPERTGEPATAQPQRVVGRPVPQPPGQGTQAPAKPAQAPAVAGGAAAGAAAASAAGAAPATTAGPAVPGKAVGQGAPATPAGARAAGTEGVSQNTVIHPPPPVASDAADGPEDEDHEEEPAGGSDGVAPGAESQDAPDEDADADEHFGDVDEDDVEDEDADEASEGDQDADAEAGDPDPDADFDDDDYDDDDDYEDDDDYDEDTGDRPAVAAPNLPPSRPLTAAGARRPVPPPALPARSAPPGRGNATGAILPPYAQSRPGGHTEASSPEPSGRRTAIMAIVGGLLLLVGVGFGATQLLGEDEGAQPADQTSQPTGGASGGDDTGAGSGNRSGAGVDPGRVTVAVLNGTTVPGLAAQIGDNVESQGFQLGTITNSTDQQRAESVVLYAPGAEMEARDVARRLKISQREEADPDSQGLAGDATVIVVAGQDKTR